MVLTKRNSLNNLLQEILLGGVLMGLTLVILGWALVPTVHLISVAGAILILVIYGGVFYFAVPRINPAVLRWASIFGLAAGTLFAGEILLEYILLPADNTGWGAVEYGSVFLVFFISSVWVAYRSKRVRSGVLSAVMSAMISSLIFLIVMLVTLYAFRGTARQTQVFKAEGTFADFASSGMADLNTFVMEDFFGACFYHLLLVGPLPALLLGTLGGWLGRGFAKLKKTT